MYPWFTDEETEPQSVNDFFAGPMAIGSWADSSDKVWRWKPHTVAFAVATSRDSGELFELSGFLIIVFVSNELLLSWSAAPKWCAPTHGIVMTGCELHCKDFLPKTVKMQKPQMISYRHDLPQSCCPVL